MIHLFEINNDYLAYDVESGVVHFVDKVAYRVLTAWQQTDGQKPDLQTLRGLEDQLGPDALDCTAEIEQAIQQGLLFAPEVEVSLEQLYPDQPRIKSMCLHLCHDCNLRCKYCFAGTGDFGTGRRTMLDAATGRQAIDFLIEASGPRHNLDIDFFGGEPLMNWPVVVELTHYCEQRAKDTGKEIRLTITTNAMLLDDEKTKFINEHFKNCVLSIDGRPDVHNDMRPDAGGKGSYDRVARHIQSFVAARGSQEYYLRGTYTRKNLDFSNDVLHLGSLAPQVSIEPVVAPQGAGYEIRQQDVAGLEREYEKLAARMFELEGTKESFNFFHFMIDLDGGPCAFKRLKGCGVGLEYCAVTPEGDIYPCHQFVGNEAFKMGHVSQPPGAMDAALTEQFKSLLVPDKPACRDCWAKYYCGGGCAANAFYASGSVNGLYEIGCALQKKRLECALWLQAKKRLAKGAAK